MDVNEAASSNMPGVTHDVVPVNARVVRCRTCGFLLPSDPSQVPHAAVDNVAQRLSGIAPGGVLRGRYSLRQCLGEGAHGVTYLAEHLFLGNLCVVKVLPSHGGSSGAAVERLRDEARAGYRVNHPAVVRVLDCDAVNGAWYFVMEYVPGVNLSEILRGGLRLPWQQAWQVGLEAAEGLRAIHRAELLHRDIKPGNLILGTDGHVRVSDLGVARLSQVRQEAGNAVGPELAGTLTYAAPEMFVAECTAGPPTDLYSLGAALFHLVTGHPPHGRGQVFRRLIDLQTRPVEWPTDAPDEIPPWFIAALLRTLAIEREARFGSVDAFIEALDVSGAPADRSTRATRVGSRPEELHPRGIGVVPFRNTGQRMDDDWIGLVLANYVWSRLSETRGIYVAGQDALELMLSRLGVVDPEQEPAALLEAGRRVGAGAVITGRFERDGDRLRVWVDLWRCGETAPERLPRVRGALRNLASIERDLLRLIQRALSLAITADRRGGELNAPQLAARERFAMGKQAFLRGEYQEAIKLARTAVELDPDFGEAIGFIGVCYARQGDYEAARAQHELQEGFASRVGDLRLEIEALANLGAMNYYRGDYGAAEQCYQRAAPAAQERGLTSEYAKVCNNLGFVLFRRGRLEQAEAAFGSAIETHRTYGSLTSLVGPYNGMGNVLTESQSYQKAREYYRRALALAEEVGDRTSVGTTHMHLGRCAALQGDFAEARHEFTMALNALEETRFWNGLALSYEHVADMNMRLGNWAEAGRCADKRIELARQHSNATMEAAAWKQKAEALARAGRDTEAAACRQEGERVQAAVGGAV